MLSFLQKMIDHLLQIRVLQIQSVFYKSNPVHVLQYAFFCRKIHCLTSKFNKSYAKNYGGL